MRTSYSILVIVLLILAVPLLWFVRSNDPLTTTIYPNCILHELTGLHCPGCGSTRAAHALLNGRLMAALAWNPFMILIAPLIFAVAMYDQRLRKNRGTGVKYFAKAVLGIVVVFFLFRNLPNPQQGLLAPKNIEASAMDQN